VTSLTGEKVSLPSITIDSKNPLKVRLLSKLFNWKKGIKEKFKKSFNGIVTDIKIFLLTNILAFGIALFLNKKSLKNEKNYYIASGILTLSIAISVWGYLDQNWFYSFLLNNFTGWAYPVGMGILFSWLLFNYYQHKHAA